MDWPPPTVVVVMAEHGPFLWNGSPDRDRFADDYVLDEEVLGVSPQLAERLAAWNARYGFDGMDDAWWDEGWSAARELRREFEQRGLRVQVLFHDVDGRRSAVGDRSRPPRR